MGIKFWVLPLRPGALFNQTAGTAGMTMETTLFGCNLQPGQVNGPNWSLREDAIVCRKGLVVYCSTVLGKKLPSSRMRFN